MYTLKDKTVTLVCGVTPVECADISRVQLWGKEQNHDVCGCVAAKVPSVSSVIPHFFLLFKRY